MDFTNLFIFPSTRQWEIVVCVAIMAFPKAKCDKQLLVNQTAKSFIVQFNDPSLMFYTLCKLSENIVESIYNYCR